MCSKMNKKFNYFSKGNIQFKFIFNTHVEYISIIIKRQFWCVSKIIEKCVGCVWLKCSADSKLIQKFITIS